MTGHIAVYGGVTLLYSLVGGRWRRDVALVASVLWCGWFHGCDRSYHLVYVNVSVVVGYLQFLVGGWRGCYVWRVHHLAFLQNMSAFQDIVCLVFDFARLEAACSFDISRDTTHYYLTWFVVCIILFSSAILFAGNIVAFV